jgi:hypothetical protein
VQKKKNRNKREVYTMPAIISDEDARYALDIVKTICTQVGPGLPGSSQEWERAGILKGELEAHLGAENVALEDFSVAPWAFLSAYPLSAVCMLSAAILNLSWGRFTGVSTWLTAVAAVVFSSLAPMLFILEFVLGLELVDPFFRKKQSVNVIGTLRKPGTENVKHLIILSGHHDSAPENTWLGLVGYGFFFLTATYLIGFITLLVMSIIQLTGTIIGNADMVRIGTLGWLLLVYPIVPAVLFALSFNRGRKNGGTVPGAADNLSASALTVAMCRFLANNPSCVPDETEIRFISFGSEEAGLRGSRRYVERHLEELQRLEARLLNIETVAHQEITILTSDLNGTVKNSPEMVKSVKTAAERAGIPHKEMPATLGVANDSGPFSQAGLKALTLLGFKVPQQMVTFYHQKRDKPEILTTEPLLNVLKLTLEWVRNGGESR